MHLESQESKEDLHTTGDDDLTSFEPISLLRSLGWAFLAPAFTAFIYGITAIVMSFDPATATGMSAVFVAALIFSTDKQDLDWFGLCFITGGVALFSIGASVASLFGGIAIFLALLTLLDAPTETKKRKLLLVGIYLLNAGLSIGIFASPAWAALGLVILYMTFYLAVRLLPFGIMAKASLQDSSE